MSTPEQLMTRGDVVAVWQEALAAALAAPSDDGNVAGFAPPTPIDCYLMIAGERVNGGEDPTDERPAVLTGLEVAWGRASTVDQPTSATATFTIEDHSGNRTFAKLAAIGQYCEVRASAIAWDTSGEGINTLPGWDSTPPDERPANVAVAPNTTTAQVQGAPSVRVLHVQASDKTLGAPTRVTIAPAAASPDVTAWDDRPQTQSGQTWTVRIASGSAPMGVALQVGIARYRNPGSAPALTWFPGSWDPAEGPFEGRYTVQATGEWLGVTVRTVGYTGMPWTDAPWASWPQVTPEGLTWADLKPGWTLGPVELISPNAGLLREVLVFAGRITDAAAEWNTNEGACMVAVTAADLSADLANRDVGAEPWAAEPFSTRVNRILTGAGLQNQVTVRYTGSPENVFGYPVTRIDVDRQQVWPMLDDLCSGVDVVNWIAVHLNEGPFVLLEDMAARVAVIVLTDDNGPHLATASAFDGMELSACDIELEPVVWQQSNSEIATRVVTYWMDQTEQPDPAERSVEVRDADLEALTQQHGVRRVSVMSQLTSEANAQRVGASVLARLSRAGGWVIGGVHRVVQPDESTEGVNAVLDLLDGTTRIGMAVLITDLPPWSPIDSERVGVYLEGGRYAYEDGRWDLELQLSDSAGIGDAMTWADMQASTTASGWSWRDFQPTGLSWSDLQGVGLDAGLAKVPRIEET